ncbi:MAG: hypothetical protein F4103_06485 [Boseongicola sp. SB0673_bin_14]|nr:hypothetical protein [Boseongicola sp. SB0673_bin_14]
MRSDASPSLQASLDDLGSLFGRLLLAGISPCIPDQFLNVVPEVREILFILTLASMSRKSIRCSNP